MLFRERQLYGKGLSVVQNCYALAGKQSVAAVEVAQSDTCAILLHFGCYLIGNHNAIALYTNLDMGRLLVMVLCLTAFSISGWSDRVGIRRVRRLSSTSISTKNLPA